MRILLCAVFAVCTVVLWLGFANHSVAQSAKTVATVEFQEGCCLNPQFPRPKNVSTAQVSKVRLAEALNCATNNEFEDGVESVARDLGDPHALHIAYYYGKYMPEQHGPALDIAVYSPDRKRGILFDISWDAKEYGIANLPALLRSPKGWKVGEVNGGLWTYTRLSYLAQELGSRQEAVIPITEIERHKPPKCSVFVSDETNWKAGDRTRPAR